MAIKEIYTVSLYWTVTTITTVGYGDISGTNSIERLFCSLIMLVGVIAFSFANGALASILTTYDHESAPIQEKMQTLNKIQNEFDIPHELFLSCKKNIELISNHDNEFFKINSFLDELPPKLKI